MGKYTNTDLSQKFAWDGDRLVTHDAKVVNKLRRKALSPSTAKSMKGCVARWAAEKALSEHEVIDPFDPAPLGTSAHALFEEMYGYAPKLRSPAVYRDLILRDSKRHKSFQVPDNATAELRALVRGNMERWRKEVDRVSSGQWQLEDPSEVEIFGLETHMNDMEIEGVPLNGFIDRIAIINGKLSPEDYKTGKVPAKSMLSKFGDDHGDQLRVYSVAIEKKFDVKVSQARVLYTEQKKPEAREVNLGARAMKKTLNAFVSGWETHNRVMEEGSFPTETGPLCGWCVLVNSCPAAKRDDYADAAISKPEKKPHAAPTVVELGIPVIRPIGQVAVNAPVNHDVNQTPDAPLNLDDSTTENRSKEMSRSDEYQLMAISGLQSAAFKAWSTAGVEEPSLDQLAGLTRTFRYVAARVMREVFGFEDLGANNHTRIRGFLFTTLDRTDPAPVGGTAEQWSEWTRILYRRTLALTSMAITEMQSISPLEDTDSLPWLVLASDVEDQFDEAEEPSGTDQDDSYEDDTDGYFPEEPPIVAPYPGAEYGV